MFTVAIEKNLKLALVKHSFATLYFDIVTQEKEYLSQWLDWPMHAENSKFFSRFIQKSLHDYADERSMVCAIFFNDELVGNISFNKIDHHLKKVEIGYWLSQRFQGNGIITKSVRKLIDIAFNELAMEKVQIAAASGNIASRNVCERLNFKLEGIITNAENLNRRIVDHAIYGLARKDYEFQ